MKKSFIFFITLILLFYYSFSYAQETVKLSKPRLELIDNTINIFYDILNSDQSDKFKIWIDARGKYHLSNTQIQMAGELGMNPKKFGSLANHKQARWKIPLPEFIEDCYYKRFKKTYSGHFHFINILLQYNILRS